ncbi:MAG: ATP-dependent DNA ligase [Chloroflexi bacterium]|nr:ATP-dependent DNA ligase [Chloroflexota bacterium]
MSEAILTQYRRKRSFPGTPEPEGARAAAHRQLTFVVQKHAAGRLHYDFRLEVDGVLKSWAVPKAPSPDPREKRLAVQVEDHPLEYATFEGVIPERRYGAGNVIVWDYGTYSPDEGGILSFDDHDEATTRMRRSLASGKVSITLRGSKLRGSWTLVRSKGRAMENDHWLLIKHRDEFAAPSERRFDELSVLSGRTLDEVSRGVPPSAPLVSDLGKPILFPDLVRPMLSSLLEKPFSHQDWLFEPKLDGVRAIAYVHDGRVELRARSDLPITDRYPEIARSLGTLPGSQLILDGEIVALNQVGIPDFELLQQRMHVKGTPQLEASVPVVYFVFDVIYADGRDLADVPLRQRKVMLRRLVPESGLVRLVHYEEGEGERFFDAVTGLGIEGMVAKAKDSPYEAGARARTWLKVKAAQEQEFVVCGYLPGKGHRAGSFGALILAYYDEGRLKYAGTVGSGFTDRDLAMLSERLVPLATDEMPLSEAIPRQVDKPSWVRPTLVVRVKFNAWTKAGVLRGPVYVGVREDIAPGLVVRERALREPVAPAQPRAAAPQDAVQAVCDQLENQRDSVTLEEGGQRLKLTHLNKVLWPALGKRAPVTKRDFVRYLALVSPHMLPHLAGRPMNLTRYPEGIQKPAFYQKHWPAELPDFVRSVELYSEHNRTDQRYILAENLMTLLWLGQLATLELHPWLSRITPEPEANALPTTFTGSEEAIESSVLNYPDFLIFDLDPYIYSGKEGPQQEPELNRSGYERAKEIAFALRDVLRELALEPFVKTSGKTGLHVYVPVLRRYEYRVIRKACAAFGRHLSAGAPGTITMDWAVERRTGRVFFDHNQNSRGKTLAAPYSLRPTAYATVSTPVTWEELSSVYPTDFTIATVPARLGRLGDPWQAMLEHKGDLRPILEGAKAT